MGMAVTREALIAVDGEQKRSREEDTRERITQWIEEAQMAAGMEVEKPPTRHRRVSGSGSSPMKQGEKDGEDGGGSEGKTKGSWFACFKWWSKK